MKKLIIKNGKFYRGDIEEKPEIGNLEQIKLIREYEKRGDLLKEGLIIKPTFTKEITANIYFQCVCGTYLFINSDCDCEDDIECLIGEKTTCYNCHKRYKVDINNFNELFVKIDN